MPEGFDILILAGGRSRRMGVDKAGIVLAGKTLLEHVLERANSWGGNRVLVVGPPRDWVAAEYVSDPPGYPHSSLLGIFAGLMAVNSPWAFITGCDMPFVKKEMVSHLWAQKNAGGAVAWWQNRLQPLPGFYPRAGSGVIAELLQENRFHLARALDCLKPAVVRDFSQVDSRGASFFNINSPDELQRAKAWFPCQEI